MTSSLPRKQTSNATGSRSETGLLWVRRDEYRSARMAAHQFHMKMEETASSHHESGLKPTPTAAGVDFRSFQTPVAIQASNATSEQKISSSAVSNKLLHISLQAIFSLGATRILPTRRRRALPFTSASGAAQTLFPTSTGNFHWEKK